MERNYKHIDLGYEFWDRDYMFRNSIAGETTEFAKPVIGTIEPPPAYLPILS